jgi:hypothetical protein
MSVMMMAWNSIVVVDCECNIADDNGMIVGIYDSIHCITLLVTMTLSTNLNGSSNQGHMVCAHNMTDTSIQAY